jgi:hypothetical protein
MLYPPVSWFTLKVRIHAVSSSPSCISEVSKSQALAVLSKEEEKIKSPVRSILQIQH